MSEEQIIEDLVRKKMIETLGVSLKKRKVILRGTLMKWEADFVSDDGLIVGEIKTADYKGKPGTAIPRNLCSPYILLKNTIGAQKRMLVYTKKALYEYVISSREGQIALCNGIEIILVEVK